jgi:hypothetical protein
MSLAWVSSFRRSRQAFGQTLCQNLAKTVAGLSPFLGTRRVQHAHRISNESTNVLDRPSLERSPHERRNGHIAIHGRLIRTDWALRELDSFERLIVLSRESRHGTHAGIQSFIRIHRLLCRRLAGRFPTLGTGSQRQT